MFQTRLIRLSGLALVVGGLLFAIGNLLHPLEHSEEAHHAATWVTAHVTFMVGMIGMLLGLPMLYARQAERSGWLGLIGYTAFFVGIVATITGSWFEAFVVPQIDHAAADAIETGDAARFNLPGGLLFMFGQVLFGIATYRARHYSRAAALVIVASGIFLLPASAMTGKVGGAMLIGGTAVLGFALAYLGWTLLGLRAGQPATEDRTAIAPSVS